MIFKCQYDSKISIPRFIILFHLFLSLTQSVGMGKLIHL